MIGNSSGCPLRRGRRICDVFAGNEAFQATGPKLGVVPEDIGTQLLEYVFGLAKCLGQM